MDDVQALRCRAGALLASCRRDAGLSQRELGQALGRTRSLISKVEHGSRGMPAGLWELADQVCHAQGVLITEHSRLAQAEDDYRLWWRARRRREQIQHAAIHTHGQKDSLLVRSALALPPVLPDGGGAPCAEVALVSAGLAEELLSLVAKIVHRVGRREAIHLAGSVLAATGLPGLNLGPDEQTRVVQAVEVPRRVDAHVINNVAVMLAYCKRLEDSLGPREVLDTVMAQHRLVHRLLAGDCPDRFRKPLHLVDSNIACALGGYLVGMAQLDEAAHYFTHARKAAHDAGNRVCAAYAAANTSFAAFERNDIPTALDAAAAARSLAAHTHDSRLKAFAEHMAAAAYALDGQHGPCMTACDRAHNFLTTNGSGPDSPAYWVHHGSIEGQRGRLLTRLGKPAQALDAAQKALAQYDPTYTGRYTLCQLRLGHALILSNEISEAASVLADAASHAHLYPRLTAELHAARVLMQPWATTPAVKTLDDQLYVRGLMLPQRHNAAGARI
ncbi:MAG: helix-turn-helix domain-containing protein [Pseudonocardiaceae bacterium]